MGQVRKLWLSCYLVSRQPQFPDLTHMVVRGIAASLYIHGIKPQLINAFVLLLLTIQSTVFLFHVTFTLDYKIKK